ncbi:MAG: DUF1343 domain-containing protein [Bdellovibrionales bacterium]|nr:DUF1343 domain-containing protein [Bdellovibrionales bacterium]
MFKVGLEVLLESPEKIALLNGKRVAYLGHPASVNRHLGHGLDLLYAHPAIDLTAGFGPQHGILGEKQDNMIESDTFIDPFYKIPMYSLYGEVRRPTEEMMESFDVILIDLQDVGCRIYTYLTTMIYVMEESARLGKEVWILDRPNPAGRPVEGVYLSDSQYTFVGATRVPIRHGLTMGELALWVKQSHNLQNLKLTVMEMEDYDPERGPGFGWPVGEMSWINPSPNLSNFYSTRSFCGSVLFEGTKLSEGRGTTRALEQFGAPGMKGHEILEEMRRQAPEVLQGVLVRPCFFEPTFQKHKGQLCGGVALHVDDETYYQHQLFQPFRFCSLALKVIHTLYPEFDLWQVPPYEYETEKMPVDMLSGSEELRLWVEDETKGFSDWHQRLQQDEEDWLEKRKKFLLY